LLFIDDPGSGEAGPGPAFPQNLCSSVSIGGGVGGCGGNGLFLNTAIPVLNPPPATTVGPVTCVAFTNGACATLATTPTNVFQGNVSSNQVIFNGVPIIAPVTGGFTRTFRITNVRINVNGLGGGGLPGTQPVSAFVSITGPNGVSVNNAVPTVGLFQPGLSTTVRNSANASSTTKNFLQCQTSGNTTASAGPTAGALLEFKENFATAFKTRIAATPSNNGTGIGMTTFNQNIPGAIYNSESGLIFNTPNGTAGLADFGTRLRAVFTNVPTGVRVFVTTTNLQNLNSASNATTINGATAVNNGLVAPTVAVMVASETVPLQTLTPPGTTFTGNGNSTMAEIVITGGTGEAVWEVVQANPSQAETVQFGVNYIVTGNQQAGTPAAGNSQVSLNYAPVNTSTTNASGNPIPRFADTSTAATVLTISLCQTNLLFPFVTNINGFDTGLSVANTTQDIFSTSFQDGTCTWNFFGSGAPPPFTTPNVVHGTVYANTASMVAPNFQGYMIAQCNFQYAHGFAFVSDTGARNLAMGYLALVLNNGNNPPAARGTGAEALAQ
jgi:hypothetical protein